MSEFQLREIREKLIEKQSEIAKSIYELEELLKQLPKEFHSEITKSKQYYIPYLKGSLGLEGYDNIIMFNLQGTINNLEEYAD